MKKQSATLRNQVGATLMELIAVLAVISTIVVGALALFGSADSAQKSTQTVQEVSALRTGVKSLFVGQSSFGTAGLNQALIKANKVPSTVTKTSGADATNANNTLKNASGATYDVTGSTASFTITITTLNTELCVGLITAATTGYTKVKIGTQADRTPPVSPADAATDCAATPSPIILTAN